MDITTTLNTTRCPGCGRTCSFKSEDVQSRKETDSVGNTMTVHFIRCAGCDRSIRV